MSYFLYARAYQYGAGARRYVVSRTRAGRTAQAWWDKKTNTWAVKVLGKTIRGRTKKAVREAAVTYISTRYKLPRSAVRPLVSAVLAAIEDAHKPVDFRKKSGKKSSKKSRKSSKKRYYR